MFGALFSGPVRLPTMNNVTQLLSAIEQGDPHAASELLPLVYDELRQLAAQKLAQEKPGQTLQPTALVHEAYLRLVGDNQPCWDSRGHFFAAAAEAMRRIPVDRARQRASAGNAREPAGRVEWDEQLAVAECPDEELLAPTWLSPNWKSTTRGRPSSSSSATSRD